MYWLRVSIQRNFENRKRRSAIKPVFLVVLFGLLACPSLARAGQGPDQGMAKEFYSAKDRL